jgi:ribosomal protein RSM22 (predicted rRNA methylase)
MWRAAAISSRSANDVAGASKYRHHYFISMKTILPAPSPCIILQHRRHSSTPHQIDEEELVNSPLQRVFEDIERQSMEADRLRAITHPTPWFNLLQYPGRAAWRSSNHAFDSTATNKQSPLSQTQFNLIQSSGKTNKQMKRTYKRIMETHQSLAIKRERERRMAANLTSGHIHPLKGEGGKLEDKKGRNVGSWKERSDALLTCDDPSVSLLLSHGSDRFTRDVSVDSGSKTKNTPVEEINAMYRSKRRMKMISSAATAPAGNATDRPVGYGPEQVMANLRYRFGPNYSIVRRVLMEVQSLLGGNPKSDSQQGCFRPKRVLDFGSGVGSSSAAALDVFGVPRMQIDNHFGIEWIHSIDASQSMRDATEGVLESVLEGVPWGHDANNDNEAKDKEELEDSGRVLNEIKGVDNEKASERQRKRMLKWEQSWELQNDYRTRLTFGESIVDSSSFYSQLSSQRDDQIQRPDLPWQKQLDEQRKMTQERKAASTSQKGSFDLILCTYTLSELNSVSSTMTAAALLWEKLAPGGVMVFVEPGTPDGFSTLRSVRSMLLECCPPREIRHLRYTEERRQLTEKLDNEEDEAEREAIQSALEELKLARDEWEEECQVIAPCTHNGLCPMSRHQKNHVKKNSRFAKYEMASENEDANESTDTGESSVAYDIVGSDVDFGDGENQMTEEDEEEKLMQELIEQGYDKDQLEEMMQLMESLQDDNALDDSDNELEEEEEDYEDFLEMGLDDDTKSRVTSPMTETDAFNTAFCSFVHNFPGGTTRKKGEKFSYLVVQKQTPSAEKAEDNNDMLSDVDIVDILAKSAHHVQGLKQELMLLAKSKSKSNTDVEDLNEKSRHAQQLRHILNEAVQIEDRFLDSTRDKLGMELVHGNNRRKGWGRLIRAPIKKKGHVLVDYCSGGCTGCSQLDGTQGRIIRQAVSRGWSSKVAPGCYAAARKSRWGGLWPDLSQRVV